MVSTTTKKTLENIRNKTKKKLQIFSAPPMLLEKLKCTRTADSESPTPILQIFLSYNMPVMTRSQTQARNDAYARFRAINARNTNAVGSWDKYRTAGEQVAFVLNNPHINVFLVEDRLFRRETYVKCYQLLQSPHCTTRIGNICMTLRSQIQDIGLYA